MQQLWAKAQRFEHAEERKHCTVQTCQASKIKTQQNTTESGLNLPAPCVLDPNTKPQASSIKKNTFFN